MSGTDGGKIAGSSGFTRQVKRGVIAIFAFGMLAFAGDRLGIEWQSIAADDTQGDSRITRSDCGYLQDPDSVHEAMARHRDMVDRTTRKVSDNLLHLTGAALVAPQDMPRKNFIDDILFARMERDNIMSAEVCTDEEFIRRAWLDITGRIPAPENVTAFLADSNPNKRDALVDSLVGSPEYVDKWTMFFSDLFKVTARSTNINRFDTGRNAFFTYVKNAISANKSYAQIATELINANGDSFVNGEANYIVGGTVPMGPAQDTMDGTAVNVSSMFLGIGALDCLLCHNGAGHLDEVNLWGAKRTRAEAWGMSAFFARTRRQRQVISQQPLYVKFIVSENPTGEYMLNTDSGNRQPRNPINGSNSVAPSYILGGGSVNSGENRRQAMARLVTSDKQFARAAVNYIWEKLMVEALVSPSNAFDPARLDPNAELPEGWTLQPANAELLEALADEFIKQNYNIQSLIRLITKSTAYQLSSQYPGEWSLALVPYYARKYARRLDAEEVHDAVLKATGVGVTYTLRNRFDGTIAFQINWAMQLPDTIEPNNNRQSKAFLDSFIRGDRDIKPRSIEPSIQQALNLMNNSFVMSRIHQNNAGSNVSKLLANQALSSDQIITQLYLNTLSRNPTQDELNALAPLFTSTSRREATETIQWTLINKMDFVFNY